MLHMIPIALPFLPPGKGASASHAGLLRQVLFFDAMHVPRYEAALSWGAVIFSE